MINFIVVDISYDRKIFNYYKVNYVVAKINKYKIDMKGLYIRDYIGHSCTSTWNV